MIMSDIGHEPRLEPPEDEVYCSCNICGESIYYGETAYNLPRWGWVCEGCIRNAMEVAE